MSSSLSWWLINYSWEWKVWAMWPTFQLMTHTNTDPPSSCGQETRMLWLVPVNFNTECIERKSQQSGDSNLLFLLWIINMHTSHNQLAFWEWHCLDLHSVHRRWWIHGERWSLKSDCILVEDAKEEGLELNNLWAQCWAVCLLLMYVWTSINLMPEMWFVKHFE